MNINQDGYLRVHRAGAMRDKYAHRLYVERLLGRRLGENETVHHLCKNKLCWPPSDFHLVILPKVMHDAIDAGRTPHRKKWRREYKSCF